MAKNNNSGPYYYPDDTGETKSVITWLLENKISFQRLTRHHIKIGPVNYYLGRGTIYIDDERQARPERGLNALKKFISFDRSVSALNIDRLIDH